MNLTRTRRDLARFKGDLIAGSVFVAIVFAASAGSGIRSSAIADDRSSAKVAPVSALDDAVVRSLLAAHLGEQGYRLAKRQVVQLASWRLALTS